MTIGIPSLSETTQNTIETVVIGVSNKSIVAGSVGSFLGWLANSGATALVAMTVALLGLVLNAYFQWRRDQRERLEHEHRMRSLQREKEGNHGPS